MAAIPTEICELKKAVSPDFGGLYRAGSGSSWLELHFFLAELARLGDKLKVLSMLGLVLKINWDIWAQLISGLEGNEIYNLGSARPWKEVDISSFTQ